MKNTTKKFSLPTPEEQAILKKADVYLENFEIITKVDNGFYLLYPKILRDKNRKKLKFDDKENMDIVNQAIAIRQKHGILTKIATRTIFCLGKLDYHEHPSKTVRFLNFFKKYLKIFRKNSHSPITSQKR
ncbi:MAG: hypothetical protein Q7T50_01440 [Candidatus Magasanikbacteria bacterium]|nr:hypothetical protein [Candidatus Magasanikbacteria bacterium]